MLILIAVTADAIILGRLREMWVRVRRRDQARAQAARRGEEAGPWRVSLARRLRSWEGLLLVCLLVVLAYNITRVPNFLTVRTRSISSSSASRRRSSVLIMTFVIISGEIDLSVASMMGLSAAVTASLFESGVPMPLAILAGAGRRRSASA